MNYKEFLIHRENELKKDSSLIDHAEMNLYGYLPKKFDYIDFNVPPAIDTAYRCHLVEHMWNFLDNEEGVTQYGIYSLASKGVRDSLNLLFRYLNNKKITIILPTNIYPKYEEIAIANNLNIKYYNNIWQTETSLNQLLKEQNSNDNNWLLICEDKFRYAGLDRGLGYKALTKWLNSNPNNKVIIDGVYLYGMSTKIAELVRKNKVIYLTSLSKAFLLPNTFGVGYVGKELYDELFYSFRSEPKDQNKLQIALSALTTHKNVNSRVKLCIGSLTPHINKDNKGYGKIYLELLFYDGVQNANKNKHLIIPMTVFGPWDTTYMHHAVKSYLI